MNKKNIAMLTSLAIGGTLLLGTAFANASQLSGYETYKAAVMNTKNLKNETVDLKLSVTDNTAPIINVNSNVKVNMQADAMSSVTTANAGGNTENFNAYRQDGKSISKKANSEEYTVFEGKQRSLNKVNKVQSPEVAKSMEVVLDTLVGTMKDKVTAVDNTDGTRKVTITLGEDDVTPLFNALTSMALAGRDDMEKHNDKEGLNNFKNVIPQLQSDIKIESVISTADVNKDNIVTDQVANIVVSGKDADGKDHKIVIDASLVLSNINSTTPEKVDLTGKQVKTITGKYGEGHRN